MLTKKIVVLINSDWFFLLHRVSIVQGFEGMGYKIVVLTKDTGRKKEIEDLGFEFINLNLDRKGINVFKELGTIANIYKIYSEVNPVLTYQVTIKPIIYGSMVSRILKLKNINTICGLGYVFSNPNKKVLRKVISLLYKFSINKNNSHSFFENNDDLNTLISGNIVADISKCTVVNGVGVNLEKLSPFKTFSVDNKINIIFPSRMLWSKGVKEFVEAALLLRNRYRGKVFFKLYGMLDYGNRESVPESYLKSIYDSKYLEWFGFERDMVSVYQNCDMVILPSYYGEGLPTSLAEACAMGLPVVTTDSVGCRNCVDNGVNGFKVPVKSVDELAKAIEALILDKNLREQMGKASRVKAEKEFNQNIIINKYTEVFKKMMGE